MHINKAGLNLIKEFEGYRPKSYQDSGGVWTIGYGHTRTAKPGLVLTKEECERLLEDDLKEAESAVSRLVKVVLTSNQFSALVSFVFNLGARALASSTLLKKLNEGRYHEVPAQLARWVYCGGKVLPGLIRRRKAEAHLWNTPDGEE